MLYPTIRNPFFFISSSVSSAQLQNIEIFSQWSIDENVFKFSRLFKFQRISVYEKARESYNRIEHIKDKSKTLKSFTKQCSCYDIDKRAR